MAFDREAYLEAKKAKKKRQKENQKTRETKQMRSTAGSSIKAPGKPRATSDKPRVSDDAESRKASRLSPEDRAALSIPQFSGGLMRPPTTFTAPPRGKKSPTYTSAGAASGAKEMDLEASHWEFSCPSCKQIKHGMQRSDKSPLGVCVDCE